MHGYCKFIWEAIAVTNYNLPGQCKAVKYEIEDEPTGSSYCHCDTCQRETGSAYAWGIFAPKDKVKIHGTVQKYSSVADSGNKVERWFCGNCGSSIGGSTASSPESVWLMGGTLDIQDKRKLNPTTEIFVKAKLPFVKENLEHSFEGDR